jgi:hypothetical protein
LILWLLLLPLALWGSCGWGMVPTIAVISFVLLGEHLCSSSNVVTSRNPPVYFRCGIYIIVLLLG